MCGSVQKNGAVYYTPLDLMNAGFTVLHEDICELTEEVADYVDACFCGVNVKAILERTTDPWFEGIAHDWVPLSEVEDPQDPWWVRSVNYNESRD